jgi:isocitrate/isopropylmalate dehydrogenase
VVCPFSLAYNFSPFGIKHQNRKFHMAFPIASPKIKNEKVEVMKKSNVLKQRIFDTKM